MTSISQEIIDNEDIVNGTCCGPRVYGWAVRRVWNGCRVQRPARHYYLADQILAFDEATNETDITAEVVENEEATDDTVFDWTGPYTEEYLDANFNSRHKISLLSWMSKADLRRCLLSCFLPW